MENDIRTEDVATEQENDLSLADQLEDEVEATEEETATEEGEEEAEAEEETEEESESVDDEDETEEETEGEDEESEDSADSHETESAPEKKDEEEPKESAEARKNRRLVAEALKLAKSKGYDSIEQMLADESGESVGDIEKRVSSDEMTDEEKIAAYDRMTKSKTDAAREAAGKLVHDRILAQIHAEYPETKGTLKSLNDVPNVEKFRDLVLNKGLTGDEAYAVCTAKQTRAKAAKATAPSGKAHLRPDSKKASGNSGVVPDSLMAQAREMFPELTDAQIRKMYKNTL